MALIEYALVIKAPQALVYRISQDYAVRYEWDPFPEEIKLANHANTMQLGSDVFIRSKLGMHMTVRCIQEQAPYRAAVTMLEGPWFLEKFAGSWIFEALDTTTTRARFRYLITTKPKLIAWFLERIAALYFSRVVRQRLEGLKTYCEKLDVPHQTKKI